MDNTILQGQAFVDLSIQLTGTAENVFDMALANNRSVTDALIPGTQVDASAIVDDNKATKVIAYYNANNIHPASNNIAPLGGIGYMGISIDFIVS